MLFLLSACIACLGLILPAPPSHLAPPHAGRSRTQGTIPQPVRGQSWLCMMRQRGQESQWAWQALL